MINKKFYCLLLCMYPGCQRPSCSLISLTLHISYVSYIFAVKTAFYYSFAAHCRPLASLTSTSYKSMPQENLCYPGYYAWRGNNFFLAVQKNPSGLTAGPPFQNYKVECLGDLSVHQKSCRAGQPLKYIPSSFFMLLLFQWRATEPIKCIPSLFIIIIIIIIIIYLFIYLYMGNHQYK